jgi:glucokinase
LPWEIEETALADKLGLQSVRLINDLEAIAWNIPHLHGEDVSQVVTPAQGPDRGAPSGNVAVVAPGTGLGEAFLVWDGKRYVAHACEGGHTDFAPTDAVQLELARFLLDRYPHVSYERVACGSGIPNVYDFFRSRGEPPEPAWLAEKLRAAEDPTPLIIGAALDESVSCPIAEAVLEVFLSVLGAEVGNLALKTNATGGIYLSGGMPRRMLAQLKSKVFLAGLRNKGRMTALVERMPVSVITNPKSALLGAAHFGLEWLQSRQELW